MTRVFPTITTTDGRWREKIAEASQLGLTEACFFPTVLNAEERREAYALLEQSTIKSIPFVHLRSDMPVEELDLLATKFGTKIFNIHPSQIHPQDHDLTKYRDRIYIENQRADLREEIKNYAGLCLDVSHQERYRLYEPDNFAFYTAILEKYPVGCWHVSAIRLRDDHERIEDVHSFKELTDFDYVVNYKKYLPPIIALELENTLTEQLEAKAYIEKKLGLN